MPTLKSVPVSISHVKHSRAFKFSSHTMSAVLRPIVICGPSGTGKSTLIKKLFAEYPDSFGYSISHTTRAPRPGEENGVAYHFVDRAQFLDLVDKKQFIEYAEFSGNLYGTSAKSVQAVADLKRRCILDIDTQGVKLIQENHAYLNPLCIFLSPPSLESLKERLTGRGTESADSLNARLTTAVTELKLAQDSNIFDVVVVNDDLERAYALLKAIIVDGKTTGDALPKFDL